jgi:type I restriction enzyme R subunit
MKQYDLVAENPESTIVAEYLSEYKRLSSYESEGALEKALIEQLQTQAYEYLPI